MLGGSGWSSGRRGGSCNFLSLRTTWARSLFPATDSIATLLFYRRCPCPSPYRPQADPFLPISVHSGPSSTVALVTVSCPTEPSFRLLSWARAPLGSTFPLPTPLGGSFIQATVADLFLNGPGLRCTVSVSVCKLMYVVVGRIASWGGRERSDSYPKSPVAL